jgi:hypothetical protein
MPFESRRVYFDEEEVRSALLNYVRQIEPHHAFRSFGNLRVEHHPVIAASLAVTRSNGESALLEFGPERVAAALILQCKRLKIPLPARAKKGLAWERGLVCLFLTMGSTSIGASVAHEVAHVA